MHGNITLIEARQAAKEPMYNIANYANYYDNICYSVRLMVLLMLVLESRYAQCAFITSSS